MKPLTRTKFQSLKQNLQMTLQQPKLPCFAQWLTENRSLLLQAKKNGYTPEDIRTFLDTHNVPATTTMIEKAMGRRGLTQKTRQLAKCIPLSLDQFNALTEAFRYWSSQNNLLTTEQIVAELVEIIDEGLQNHYDFEDIAKTLKEQGYSISVRSLKKHYKNAKQDAEITEVVEIPKSEPAPNTAKDSQDFRLRLHGSGVQGAGEKARNSSPCFVLPSPLLSSSKTINPYPSSIEPAPTKSTPKGEVHTDKETTSKANSEKTISTYRSKSQVVTPEGVTLVEASANVQRQSSFLSQDESSHNSLPKTNQRKPLARPSAYDDEAELEKIFNL